MAIITHTRKEVKRIIGLLKGTSVKIEFKTWNTVRNITKSFSQTDKYGKSGTYQENCLDCSFKYIGLTEYFIVDIENIYKQLQETVAALDI
jgi:hypothetical protein